MSLYRLEFFDFLCDNDTMRLFIEQSAPKIVSLSRSAPFARALMHRMSDTFPVQMHSVTDNNNGSDFKIAVVGIDALLLFAIRFPFKWPFAASQPRIR